MALFVHLQQIVESDNYLPCRERRNAPHTGLKSHFWDSVLRFSTSSGRRGATMMKLPPCGRTIP